MIFCATASLPTLISPALELIETAPVASISTVVAPLNDVAPVPPITIDAVPSVNVMAFTDVNVTASASKLTAVDAALPTWIVLAAAPEPILIFCATASSPTLIAPPVELIETVPVASISTVVAPLKVVAPVPPITIDAVPSVNVIAFTDVNVTSCAFNLTLVDAALPTWIVLADAPEPILIFWATASLPTLIIPADEFIEMTPVVSTLKLLPLISTF